jgi:acetylxylan esterase
MGSCPGARDFREAVTRNRISIAALLAATLGLLPCMPARAASLQPVSDWGADGVPTTVSMYIYVPDNLAINPPILVLVHYCGGTASAVFGQAQGGGIVQAADQHGFIMVVPQAANADGRGHTRQSPGHATALGEFLRLRGS